MDSLIIRLNLLFAPKLLKTSESYFMYMYVQEKKAQQTRIPSPPENNFSPYSHFKVRKKCHPVVTCLMGKAQPSCLPRASNI